MSRVVRDRVADVRTLDVPVVVEEDTSHLESRGARDVDVADEPVPREVDVIRELDRDPERRVLQSDVRDQRILDVAELAVPGGIVEPGEPAVDEESSSAHVAHGLFPTSHPSDVHFPNPILPT